MNTRQSLEIERQRLTERFEEQPEGRVFAPLADCHRKLGNLDEALQICLTGLARHPDYSSAHVILGKIHLERGDDTAARGAFEKVLELDGQNLLALRQLAEMAEAADDLEEAEDRWSQVASVELDAAYAEERLGRIRERRNGTSGTEAVVPVDETVETDVEEEAEPVADAGPESEGPELDTTASEAAEDRDAAALAQDAVETPAGDPKDRVPVEDRDDDQAGDGLVVPTEEPLAGARVPVDGPGDRSPDPVQDSPPPGVPTAEIATMTLAEIYAEQGFRSKAAEIYRQILERNPDATGVRERLERLEAEIAAGGAERPEPSSATRGRRTAPAEGLGEPEARPSPPIEARTSPESEELDERERFSHFRSWLDRIRVDEN